MRKSEIEKIAAEEKKAKILGTIKSVILVSCAFFTIFTMIILSTQLSSKRMFMEPMRFFLIYPFALCLSLANLIFKAKSLNVFVRLIIHLTVSTLSFYLFMCAPIENVKPTGPIFLFAVTYIIIAAITLIVLKIKKKKSTPKSEYVSMFGKASGK